MSKMETRPAPLTGKRVLDLSRVLAGPWSTMILADLGAEVIKIEHPVRGDDTRQWGPPDSGGEASYYLCANRNKRSLALDLATEQGQAIIKQLAANADILVENYKTGGLEKYGLDYASLSALNPRLIYCSISGYGRNSPIAKRPGYDYVIQAESGLMAVNGEVDGEPLKVGIPVADLFTGMAATQAILAAIIAAERDGIGQHIDMALLDTQISMLANVGSAYLSSGEEAKRYGNGHPNVVPYQVFDSKDGNLVIAVGNERQFSGFAKLIGMPQLCDDPRFAKNSGRLVHREALLDIIIPAIAAQTTDFWLNALREQGIPCGEVRAPSTAIDAPEVRARDMVKTMAHPTAGEISLIGSPLKFSDTPVIEPTAPPLLGEHSAEILAELGYDAAQIAQWTKDKIVGKQI